MKDIPTLVREAAAKWRERFAQKAYMNHLDQYSGPSPLDQYVDAYMKNIFEGLLDEALGIERRFGRVELKDIRDRPSVAKELLEKARPRLMAMGERLFAGMTDIVLTPRERAEMKAKIRRVVIHQIERRLEELAKQRAEAITADALDKFMSDEEWIPIVEERMTNGKKSA